MAENLTLARPYAEAAFKLALESGTLPQWSDALSRLAVVMRTEVARELSGNPRLTNDQVAGLVGDASGVLDVQQRNFVRVLAANERLGVMTEIAEVFEAQRNAHEGVVDARIASAYPLSQQQVDEVVATLEAKYGRKVKATVSVDGDLIGGITIRIGDEVIDTSVRGKLAQLADALMN
jgi:F-type H+-transporting ATPase subunit delta